MSSLQQYGYAYDAGAQSDTSSPYSTYAPLEPHHPVASTSSSPVHGYGATRSPPRARQYIPRPLDWRPDFIAHAGATSSQKGRNITISTCAGLYRVCHLTSLSPKPTTRRLGIYWTFLLTNCPIRPSVMICVSLPCTLDASSCLDLRSWVH